MFSEYFNNVIMVDANPKSLTFLKQKCLKRFRYVIAVLISVVFICSSCGENAGKESLSDSKQLKITEKKLRIEIDNQTSNFSFGLNYYKNPKPWLFNFNHLAQEIQLYDLHQKEIQKKLVFEKEGDQGIGNLTGFHIHNFDSIFLFTSTPNAFYLTDSSISFIKKINYKVPEGYSPPNVRLAPFTSPPIIRKNQIIVKTQVPGNFMDMNNEKISASHLSYSINMETEEVNLLPHYFPKDYLSEGFRLYEFSMAASADKIVYSFFGDHHLYYAVSGEPGLKPIYAQSKYLPQDLPTLSRSAESTEIQTYLFTSPRYESLIYDPYREVFYRFCFPSIELHSGEELNQLRSYAKKFSIMVLDNELNCIGETLFDGKNYVPNNVFVAEEGLYISTNHPENTDNQEDFLSFVLYELVDNQ